MTVEAARAASARTMARRAGLPGPLPAWKTERDRIREAVLLGGFDPGLGAFARALGEAELDASALLLPRYGMLPADDPRLVRTAAREGG